MLKKDTIQGNVKKIYAFIGLKLLYDSYGCLCVLLLRLLSNTTKNNITPRGEEKYLEEIAVWNEK